MQMSHIKLLPINHAEREIQKIFHRDTGTYIPKQLHVLFVKIFRSADLKASRSLRSKNLSALFHFAAFFKTSAV
jgi:hypothetical protein